MGSVPSLVLSHIIIPDVPLIDQQKYLNDIIDAANSVFKKEGASIIGGHTSKGKELQLVLQFWDTLIKTQSLLMELTMVI